MSKIAILGAGAWGTALAVTIARSGGALVLAVRRAAQLDAMRASGENAVYLPGIKFPSALEITDDWERAVCDADTIVMAVPSRFARAAIVTIAHTIPSNAMIVSVTKGLEPDTLLTMSAMLSEVAGPPGQVAAISGPGFAAEVARGKPAALVAAARDDALAAQVQALFAVRSLRIYRSNDWSGSSLAARSRT